MLPIGRRHFASGISSGTFSLYCGRLKKAISNLQRLGGLTDTDKNPTLALLVTVDEKRRRIFDSKVREVKAKNAPMDDLWGFVYTKVRKVARYRPERMGSHLPGLHWPKGYRKTVSPITSNTVSTHYRRGKPALTGFGNCDRFGKVFRTGGSSPVRAGRLVGQVWEARTKAV